MRVLKKILNIMLKGEVNQVPADQMSKVYFCHVPKCAGSAITSALYKGLYRGYRVSRFGIDLLASSRCADAVDFDMMDVRKVILAYNLSLSHNHFGAAHCFCPPNIIATFENTWNFVTILRDPVERWISEYVYNRYKNDTLWGKSNLDIEEYLRSYKGRKSGQSYLYYFSSISNASCPAKTISQYE